MSDGYLVNHSPRQWVVVHYEENDSFTLLLSLSLINVVSRQLLHFIPLMWEKINVCIAD